MPEKLNFPVSEYLDRRDLADYLSVLVNGPPKNLERAVNVARGLLPFELQMELIRGFAMDELNYQANLLERQQITHEADPLQTEPQSAQYLCSEVARGVLRRLGIFKPKHKNKE